MLYARLENDQKQKVRMKDLSQPRVNAHSALLNFPALALSEYTAEDGNWSRFGRTHQHLLQVLPPQLPADVLTAKHKEFLFSLAE